MNYKAGLLGLARGRLPQFLFLTLPFFILDSPCFITGKDLLRPCLGCRTLFPQRLVFAMVRAKKKRRVTGSMEQEMSATALSDVFSRVFCLAQLFLTHNPKTHPTQKTNPTRPKPKKAFI